MHNVAPSIVNVGLLIQWSADTTEYTHIGLIEDSAELSNNKDYDSQICRFLDRREKCCLFDNSIILMLASHCDINPDLRLEHQDVEGENEDLGNDEAVEQEDFNPQAAAVAVLADLQ